MSRRRYKLNVTDMDALAAAFPKAVDEVHIPEQIIPARTERKANYMMLANLLDAGATIPGIEVLADEENNG